MTLTGTATFEVDLPSTPPVTPPNSAPAQYDAKVIRIRANDNHQDHELERELKALGLEGWYPSGSFDDILILSRLISPVAPSGPVRGTLTITTKGAVMPGLTVDTTPGSESVTYGFADDHGNPDAAPAGDGSGIAVAFATSDPTLATVGDPVPSQDAEGNPTFTAPITVVTTAPSTPGVTFSGTATNIDGGALTAASGATWIDPEPVTVPIGVGEPVEGTLSAATN
jgi:hypothetical protein